MRALLITLGVAVAFAAGIGTTLLVRTGGSESTQANAHGNRGPTSSPSTATQAGATETPTAAGQAIDEATPTATFAPTDTATETATATPEPVCKVTAVIDGDTIDVAGCEDAGRVRLLLVDTPEAQGDCYAEESTAYVSGRLLGAPVVLERDSTDLDQYDRKLRYLWLGDELFNETMVREGYAKLLVFENVRYRDRLAVAEAAARIAGRGLWGACGTGACSGPVTITALDKRGETVTVAGNGDLTGWRLVSERGAASQRYDFPSGFVLEGRVTVESATGVFPDTARRLWWTAENVWNNSEDDDALLYDSAGLLVCEFDDGV